MTYDTLVIGGGMAGLTAASRLADLGSQTAVISKGDPVCGLSTGCIDITDAGLDPIAAIGDLPEDHPYRLVSSTTVEDAVEYFAQAATRVGPIYCGSARKNQQVLTPMGRKRTTALVPETMVAPEAEQPLFIVSFKGMRDFYPSYFQRRIPNCSHGEFDGGIGSVMGLAARFEVEAFRSSFASWLGSIVPNDRVVGMPAVLGLDSSDAIKSELESRTGLTIFEIATIPPSVPGVRLYSLLKRAIRDRGVEFFYGSGVAEFQKSGSSVTRVRLEIPGRPRWIEAKRFLLATGSLVSGGLESTERTVVEPIFGLPVFVPGLRSDWFHNDFFAARHPVQKAGIVVDREFRPVSTDWDNLHVCGGILANGQVIRYQCGHGVALATGYAAAGICAGAA